MKKEYYKFKVLDKKILINYKKYLKEKNFKLDKEKIYNCFKAFLIIQDINITSDNSTLRKKNKINYIYYLFSFIPLIKKEIYGPGSLQKEIFKRVLDRILYKILLIKLSKIKIINYKKNFNIFKNQFKKKEIYIEKIPKVFFTDPIENFNFSKIKLYTNSFELSENTALIKNFFMKNNFKIQNIIHGGSFFEWRDSIFEKIITDLVSHKPKMQNMIIDKKIKKKNINFIYAMRGEPRTTEKIYNKNYYLHLKKRINISILESIVKEFRIKFKIHPRKINDIYEKFNYRNLVTNKILNKSVIIFDCLSSSLCYWLIANNIPFIYLLNKINLKVLSKNKKKYYMQSKANGALLEVKSICNVKNYLYKIKKNEIKLEKILLSNKKLLKVLN